MNNTLFIGDCNGFVYKIELKEGNKLDKENVKSKSVIAKLGKPVTALEVISTS